VTATTPAFAASSSMNFSIAAARLSLSSSYWAAVARNAAANSGVDVCYFHFSAVALYSLRHSPGIHLYAFVSSRTSSFFTGFEAGEGHRGVAAMPLLSVKPVVYAGPALPACGDE
jgi:hypothetical protein